MLRLIAYFVAISLMTDGAKSQLARNIVETIDLIKWPLNVFHITKLYENLEPTKNIIEEALKAVEESASKLNFVERETHSWCVNTPKPFDMRDSQVQITSVMSELCHHIHKVDSFYNESKKYRDGEKFSAKTLKEFHHQVLWGDVNLPDSLGDLHDSFLSVVSSSGLLPELHQRMMQGLHDDCDNHMSAQQKIYNFYIRLMISEIKGLITLQRIYLTKRLMNTTGDTYVGELEYAKQRCESRLLDYHRKLIKNLDIFPKQIRRCDIKNPNRGNNVVELRKFSRFKFFNPQTTQNSTCGKFSTSSELARNSTSVRNFLYNCKSFDTSVKICLAKRDSYRNYLWFKDGQDNLYGHNASCSHTVSIQGRWKSTSSRFTQFFKGARYDVCACSSDLNGPPTNNDFAIWRISVTDQIADFYNNMVVTGIRFVTSNNALHIQISQANFSHSGMLHDHGGWKKLDTGFGVECGTSTEKNMSYVLLRHDRKTLYLDDINVPEGYAITGIRFHVVEDSAFKLQIHANPFDLRTGKVNPVGGGWFDASQSAMRPKDYERKRVAINLDNSDDPTNNTKFEYDLESNKMVVFTHTDIQKDAGQTTIPLFHAEPVETQPPFPLSAIGLSYRGKEGFGGYVAPRIYTLDIAPQLKLLKISSSTIIRVHSNSTSDISKYKFSLLNQEDVSNIHNTKYVLSQEHKVLPMENTTTI